MLCNSREQQEVFFKLTLEQLLCLPHGLPCTNVCKIHRFGHPRSDWNRTSTTHLWVEIWCMFFISGLLVCQCILVLRSFLNRINSWDNETLCCEWRRSVKIASLYVFVIVPRWVSNVHLIACPVPFFCLELEVSCYTARTIFSPSGWIQLDQRWNSRSWIHWWFKFPKCLLPLVHLSISISSLSMLTALDKLNWRTWITVISVGIVIHAVHIRYFNWPLNDYNHREAEKPQFVWCLHFTLGQPSLQVDFAFASKLEECFLALEKN